MNEYFFSFRSLTQAYAAQKTLQQKGIEASVVNTPMLYAVEGCGYSVKVSEQDAQSAQAYLRKMNIVYQKVFRSPGHAAKW